MKGTKIQWTDDTVNITTGCDGCELWIPGRGGSCYAGNFHEDRLAKALPDLYDPVFTNVKMVGGRLAKAIACQDLVGRDRPDKPWMNGLRRKIFVGDLGDIFSRDVTNEYLKSEVVDLARSKAGVRHDLLLLTKQPRRALAFASWLNEPWPENVWLGTSVTGVASLGRLNHLTAHPAKIKFISMEPQVEDVDIAPWIDRIDWVIQGGESDQPREPARVFAAEWARKVRDLCFDRNVPYFLKQMGSKFSIGGEMVTLSNTHGDKWEDWPEDLRVRQMPAI